MDFCPGLIYAALRLKLYIIYRTAIVGEGRITEGERNSVHPACSRRIWIVWLYRRLEVARFAGDFMARIAVVDHTILDLDMRCRIGEQNSGVWFGRRYVDVAKVRAALFIECHPGFEPFHLEILQVDVSSQIKGIKIFYSDSRQQPINLSEFISGLPVVELDAEHFNCLRGKRRVEIFDLGANPVISKRVLNLARNVTIYITKPVYE